MNKEIIDNLQVLSTYYTNKDVWRERAYKNAIYAIKRLNFQITNINQLNNVKGVGKSTKEKIDELLKTGKIEKVEEIKKIVKEPAEKETIIDKFTKIWGVGPVKANELYNAGFRTIEDIEKHMSILNDQQKIGIKYYEELLKPIDRHFITIYQFAVRYVLTTELGDDYKMVVAGSYRRKKDKSGDIDILISSENFGLYDSVKVLQKWKLISDVLSMREEKFMGVGQCASGEKHFRVDIEFVPIEEWYTALVYFTGSQMMNILLRTEAKKLGYTLNQHGLYVTNTGEKLEVKSEEDVFKIIGLEYLKPEDR